MPLVWMGNINESQSRLSSDSQLDLGLNLDCAILTQSEPLLSSRIVLYLPPYILYNQESLSNDTQKVREN